MVFRQPAPLLALATCAALLLPPPVARGAEGSGWRQAVDRFAHERTLAEGCVSLLKTFADRDPMGRVQGQRLYARAKADVDGLIALLKVDLAGERSPATIPELRYRLEAVPKQRQALCEHVDAAVGTAIRGQGGASTLRADLLTLGTGETEDSLVAAIVELWRAYRRADNTHRKIILSAIEAGRWLPYAEVL